jgi:hypothetical protein
MRETVSENPSHLFSTITNSMSLYAGQTHERLTTSIILMSIKFDIDFNISIYLFEKITGYSMINVRSDQDIKNLINISSIGKKCVVYLQEDFMFTMHHRVFRQLHHVW